VLLLQLPVIGNGPTSPGWCPSVALNGPTNRRDWCPLT